MFSDGQPNSDNCRIIVKRSLVKIQFDNLNFNILKNYLSFFKSSSIYDSSSDSVKHQIVYKSLLNMCFLKKPLFLMVLFALPIFIVLLLNLVIFIFLFFKTKHVLKPQNDDAENEAPGDSSATGNIGDEKKNHLFLKLAVMMGLPWFVYIIAMCLVQIPGNMSFKLSLHLIGTIQTSIQGLLLVAVLLSNATYEKLFVKMSKSLKKNNKNKTERVKIHPIQNRLTVL